MMEYQIAFLDATISAFSDEIKDPKFKWWLVWLGLDIVSLVILNLL